MFCYLPQSFTSSEWYILCSYCVMCHLYDMVGNLLMFVNVLTDVRDTADRIPELLVGYRVGLYLCSVLLQLLAKPHGWKWLTMFSFLKSVCVCVIHVINHSYRKRLDPWKCSISGKCHQVLSSRHVCRYTGTAHASVRAPQATEVCKSTITQEQAEYRNG